MNIAEQQQFAELLRSYFLEFADLPVAPGYFSLDGLLSDGASMSMQVTGGQTIKRYIDDSRVEELHFTIFYKAPALDDNEAKSAMLGTLNGIGAWLEEAEQPPFLGDNVTINKLEQVQLANIASQTETDITYQAGFILGYETYA